LNIQKGHHPAYYRKPGQYQLLSKMVHITIRNILSLACLAMPILAQATSMVPSESPNADADLICSTLDETDCYPRTFEATKDFQVIKEGQDIPPGLHVRMNINSGEREARLNIPMEGEDDGLEAIKDLPTEQSVVVVPQPDPDPEESKPAMRDQVPISPPVYDTAGKVPPPPPTSGDEISTFQTALIFIKTEARAFDKALDDLSELAHDIYYGLEIAKDAPVLEKLLCLIMGSGSEKFSATEKGRDHKAASILASAVQNNPTALKEVGKLWKMLSSPTCGMELLETKTRGKGDFVSILRSRLGREKDPQVLKAKVTAISNLLKEPTIRKNFLDKGGMELMLAIFLKKGVDFDGVRQKVAQLANDNFLDESMGASLGEWPKMPVNEGKVCNKKGRMLEDGCWEYHVDSFFQVRQTAFWARDFGTKLRERREEWGDSIKDREL
jgi:nucleotide exchange factor SIL1